MAFSFTRLSLWLLGGKGKAPALTNGTSLNPSNSHDATVIKDTDSLKFSRNLPSNGTARTNWHNKEEWKTDKQCDDLVLIQSDGSSYFSGSEPDGPDWSIGWVEPHGQNFDSDDEEDDGFAVLVPCYRSGCKELVKASNNHIMRAIRNLPYEFSSEGLWSDFLLSRASESLAQPK